MTPERIQLRRTKGWRMPFNTVNVARPTPWGNPCKVGMFKGYDAVHAVADFERWINRDLVVRSFEGSFGKPPQLEMIRKVLAGKNLACWCKLGDPCHADVLLRLANDGGADHGA